MLNRFFILFLLLGNFSFSQTVSISGSCIDKKGAPLADVYIQFSGKKPGFTISDSLGNFQFIAFSNDTLKLVFKIDFFELFHFEPDLVNFINIKGNLWSNKNKWYIIE